MDTQRQVIFRITETRSSRKRVISVDPSLINISHEARGDYILLAIAANCVRTVAKRDGLERAVERFCNLVVNHVKTRR